jgi:DNA-binding CsgD family transcriptional regulator
MYIFAVEKLARYLISPGLTVPDVCKFLVLETFAHLKSSAVYASEITEDGHLAPVGTFGLTKEIITEWGNIPLSIEAPLTVSVRTNQVVLIRREEAIEKFPILIKHKGIPDMGDSHLVTPILPFGAICLTLDSVPVIDPDLEAFLRAVGALVSLFIKRPQVRVDPYSRKDSVSKSRKQGVLTTRQILIKGLMEKGYTNLAIGNEIGYSESLVRQETMAIYVTLNISGRRELLERSAG